MTNAEFWEVANNWYQRTHKLRVIWQDESLSIGKRERAFNLHAIMLQRMTAIQLKAIELSQPKRPNQFPSGGIVSAKGAWINKEDINKELVKCFDKYFNAQ